MGLHGTIGTCRASSGFHGRGQQLPPWEDGASRRSRRISLVLLD